MNKKCFKCKKSKLLSKFYKHKQMADGRLGKCKKCTKKDVQKRYDDPIAKKRIIEYERERWKNPIRRKNALEYQKIRREKYKGKNRARMKISNGLRNGTVIKKPCEICNCIKVEAHHIDYRKPLEVKWLCRKHHLKMHNKKNY